MSDIPAGRTLATIPRSSVLAVSTSCAGSGHMGLGGFGCPVLAKVFHWGEQVRRAVGTDMVVEVLILSQGGSGVLDGEVSLVEIPELGS